jgi:hypothetical protein
MANQVEIKTRAFQDSQGYPDSFAMTFTVWPADDPDFGVSGSTVANSGRFASPGVNTQEGHLIMKFCEPVRFGATVDKRGHLILIGDDAEKYEIQDGRLIYNGD